MIIGPSSFPPQKSMKNHQFQRPVDNLPTLASFALHQMTRSDADTMPYLGVKNDKKLPKLGEYKMILKAKKLNTPLDSQNWQK